jgi:hypothetical protein
MSVRKYITEFGLQMRASKVYLLQQDHLETLKDLDEFQGAPSHIYIIASLPKITIDSQSYYLDDKFYSLKFNIQKQNSYTHETFTSPIDSEILNTQLDCPYPHTEYKIKDNQGNICKEGKAAILLLESVSALQENDLKSQKLNDLQNLLSFEVLYIGQSYGKEGERTAIDRLPEHKTFQKIYFKSNKNHPDKDVWIILFTFEKSVITTIDPNQNNYGATIDESNTHTFNVCNKVMNDDAVITEKQSINFTEAALIRYFQPEYNEKFKNNFPDYSHSSYSECYDLDISSVIIVLSNDLDKVKFKLHSSKILPDYDHIIQFNLHSKNERKSMFELSNLISNE